MIFDERLHVRAENVPVRMRDRVVREAGRVVPDVYTVADLAPCFQVADEGTARTVRTADPAAFVVTRFKRVREARFNGAETDTNVVTRTGDRRRRTGVVVRQRVENHIREFRFQTFRNRVDKAEQGTCRGTFLTVDGETVFTLTVAEPVVLGDRDNLRLRIRL